MAEAWPAQCHWNAVAKLPEKEWDKEKITMPKFELLVACELSGKRRGQLRSQKWNTRGMLFLLFCMLHVDDGALLLFESRNDLVKGQT